MAAAGCADARNNQTGNDLAPPCDAASLRPVDAATKGKAELLKQSWHRA
eukprot:CAMPEP_0172894632 /NCGR_PEP_ID=MMETSP1075-20121228/151335_1 /TAXON_ID=2916 /ORGANISM="Ceratium fusus, Strain PA161109" /LENGTH=48 /DNA_ID= /DNA_START= /DNA_END= /DNA_ORIENTATION=